MSQILWLLCIWHSIYILVNLTCNHAVLLLLCFINEKTNTAWSQVTSDLIDTLCCNLHFIINSTLEL